jgi:hypothetical protein
MVYLQRLRYRVLFSFIFLFAACSLFAASDPIDIVYTWVDGADPAWQAIRDVHYREHHRNVINYDSNSTNRYRDHNELKYSLRSLNMYAPYINHIYIVTFSQVPKWLKNHPKITIIDHKQIFPNKSDLPTFNSQSIESNLHRIPGLSEKFIYFNDDVFLTSPSKKTDFFGSNDQLVVYLSLKKCPNGYIVDGEGAYQSSWKNTNNFLNSYFKKENRYTLAHAPFALRKSVITELEGYFPHIFKTVSGHKFRMATDFTMTNGLIQYFALYTKRARLKKGDSIIIRFTEYVNYNLTQYNNFLKEKYKFLCIEDIAKKENDEADLGLYNFLEYLFPKPAPWEKPDNSNY